ncbi:MAG TPA: shikimate kinase [Candidatus Paceibacterota bacterium]
MHLYVPRRTARPLVALIGMPSAGKTKIGKSLAERLHCDFVDTDERIASRFNTDRLQDVVDRLSAAAFATVEEEVVLCTTAALSAPTVIATGGSVVYSHKAMAYLYRETHVVHLCASLEVIERRIAKHPDRGLVLAPGDTIADLYQRRMPLYTQWEHRQINTDCRRRKVAKQLAAQLVKENIICTTSLSHA